MNSRNKSILIAGIVLSMLVVPAIIVIVLHSTGENKFALPLDFSTDTLRILSPNTPNCPDYKQAGTHRIPPFSFTNQAGNTYGSKDLAGKIYVAGFIFTNCPDICPAMSSQMLRVQEAMTNKPDVRFVSFSVDPERDSVPALKAYADRFRMNTQTWNLLTGDKTALYDLARCGFYIASKPNEEKPNDFIHSSYLILVDKESRIRGYYEGTSREDVDRLIAEIQVLALEYENK